MPGQPSGPPLLMEQYTYELPAEKIASHPLDARDASQLLVYDASRKVIEDETFRNLANYLPENSLLVANTTRVIAARLGLRKATGGRVEVLLTDPVLPLKDPAAVLAMRHRSVWRCLIGGRNVAPGAILRSDTSTLTATVIDRTGTEAHVELAWDTEQTLSEIIASEGTLPLPPYLQREAEVQDRDRYQTVYAEEEGSVAAPTAGLHFTDSVFASLAAKNIQRAHVTLHVGLGTFQPVNAADVRNHTMHEERFGFSRTSLQQLLAHLDGVAPWITAVGTTSLRTLESVFALGARLAIGGKHSAPTMEVDQWDAFNSAWDDVLRADAVRALLAHMDSNNTSTLWGETRLMLAPGCRIAMADALITNFHQPGNTLLLLVAAFIGDEWRTVYNHALENNYRFLSYGDSSLLIRQRR